MTANPSESAPARENPAGVEPTVQVPDDAGTPPGEGQIPAHDPQDDPAENATEASAE